ncbi:MAG: hypothetical protein AB1716_13275 [Planctomycetota bacterium]
MTHARVRLQRSVIVGFLAVLTSPALGQTEAPAPPGVTSDVSDLPPPAAPAPNPALDPLLERIRAARNASAAIAAYTGAQAAAPGAAAPADAFLRRVVELGKPLLAEEQARTLLEADPEHGMALAVLAYANGARQDTATAIDQAARAVAATPHEPFVLRTAGQLVAWYATRSADYVTTTAERRALQRIRSRCGGKRAYTEAFREARDIYAEAEIAAAAEDVFGRPQQPAQPVPRSRVPQPWDDWEPYPFYGPGGIGFYGYPGYYGWPGGGIIIFGDDDDDCDDWDHHGRRRHYDRRTHARGDSDTPVRNPQPLRGPLFKGPGTKDANLPSAPRPRSPSIWGGPSDQPGPQLWGGGRPPPNPQTAPPQPGAKPNNLPVPGAKQPAPAQAPAQR